MGINGYRKLLEAKIAECDDINNAPFGVDPAEARALLAAKKSALVWALEMLGSDDGEPVAYLREKDAGTDVACWVVCLKGDPGAEPVYLWP